MSRPLESAIDTETGEIHRRSLPQNARLHAMLTDISEQANGAANGSTWRAGSASRSAPSTASSCCRTRSTSAPRRRGEQAALARASASAATSMADFLTELQAFGDERGVKWGDGQ
jgi:hypothetical protein